MITAFDTLLDSALAVLKDGMPLAGGRVFEGIDIAEIPAECESALVISLGRTTSARNYAGSGSPVQWQVPLRISAFVRDNGRTPAGRPVWALAQDAHTRVMRSDIGTQVLQHTLAPDTELGATRMGVVDLVYVVQVDTGYDNLNTTE